MKFPKHRANIYVVSRYLFSEGTVVSVGVFPTEEGAKEYQGACIQEYIDRNYDPAEYEFVVDMTTYYDA